MSVNDVKTRINLELSVSDMSEFESDMGKITTMADELDIACVSLLLDFDATRDSSLKPFIGKVQEKGIAVVLVFPQDSPSREDLDGGADVAQLDETCLAGQLARVSQLAGDGVHLGRTQAVISEFEEARHLLGENAIIGADCGLSRHLAMAFGEAGAEYVGFSVSSSQPVPLDAPGDELTNMVNWWQDLFEIPCVALNPSDRSELEALLQIPADFVTIGAQLWPHLRDDPDFFKWLAGQCPQMERSGQE